MTPSNKRILIYWHPPISPALMAHRGARFPAEIQVSHPDAEFLVSQGQPEPPSISGLFLLDTGAQGTTITTQSARMLGLRAVDTMKRIGISGIPEIIERFYIRLVIGIEHNGTLERYEFHPLVGTNSKITEDGLLGIIGRDILQYTRFTYDGLHGLYILEVDFNS